MSNAENVRVGAGGVIRVAPLGTPIPDSIDDSINAAFHDVGMISDAGAVEGQGTSTTNIKQWNGDVVRTVQTEHNATLKFMMIETNPHSLELFYGNYTPGLVEVNGLQPPKQCAVIDVFDEDALVERKVIPIFQVTDRADVAHVNGAATGYEVTATCYPDPDYSGDQLSPAKIYKYYPTGS